MPERLHFVDERATSYATVTDFFRTFTEEMHSLYLLSFLLTADTDKAEQCFVSAIGECVERIGVFMEWAGSWARRAVLKYAIHMIMPVPEHPESVAFGALRHMKRFDANGTLAMLLFSLISVGMTSAASIDRRLLSLVPPGSQIVAGVSLSMLRGRPDGFLMMSHNNVVDRRDLISLVGVDDSVIIHQIIFAAGGSDTSKLPEHSLLLSGHFDQTRIFKAGVENGAKVSEFRGIRVLVLQPFERELGTFKDVRWLAVIDSKVALFGTISSVQQELDRHLAASAADASLTQKLARLRNDDATWSVLRTVDSNYVAMRALGSLDPILANLVHDGDSFQFGVRYGRKVEVEYEITAPSRASAQAHSNSLTQSLVGASLKGFSPLPRPDMTGDSASVHGVVKVAMTRYKAWLAEIARAAIIGRGDEPLPPPGQGLNENGAPRTNSDSPLKHSRY
jgi:hypothetical protein